MKKQSIIFGLALAMLTVGCAKDATEDVAVKGNEVTIGVTADATRTSLGAKDGETYPVLWSKGDQVSVNGVASKTIAEQFVGTASAQFTVEGVAAPYKVVYPAGAAAEGGYVIVAATKQDYVANSFDGAFAGAAMVGYSESEQVAMKNVCGFIKLPIKKGDEKNIQKVVIRTNNLESIAGTFDVNYETGEIIRPYAGTDVVEVSADETIPYVEDMAVVVAAVAPGTYAKGFTVEVIAADGAYMTKTAYAATGCTVNAGKVLVMPEIEFFPNKQKTEITNATQLQAFLDAASAGDYSAWKNNDGVVELGDDIDLTGVTIKPATSFDGVFDGRNHFLYNWKSDGTALFTKTTADAVVKNIIIAASCSMDVSNAAAGDKAFIVATNLGIVSGCQNYADMVFAPANNPSTRYNIAAIVGVSGDKVEKSLVTNCYNAGNLTVTMPSMTGASYYFGGIVANTQGVDNVDAMTNNINKGDITVTIDGAEGWKNVYLGGLAGACNTKGVIRNCVNEGKVDFYLDKAYKSAYINIGGITGYTACHIQDCKNYGDVSIRTNTYKATDAPQITRPAIAGIAGYVNGNVSGCENHGHILLQGTKDVRFAGTTASSSTGNIGHPVIGGICGSIGYPKEIATSARKCTISDCHNYGTVEVINPAGLTWMSIGGVVGFPTGTVKNCVNEKSGIVKVTMGGSQTYLGGVYGATYESSNVIDGCANYGKVWFVDSKAIELGKGTTRSYAGGISGGYNKGSKNAATNCVNEGEIIAEAKMVMIAGGLFGGHNGPVTDCVNRGTVTVKNATAETGYLSEVGGIVGYVNGVLTNCSNYGVINNNSDAGTDTGAIAAAQGGANAIVGGVVDCTINASESNVGLVIGSTRSEAVAVTLGSEEAPITIKKTTTINGAAVTDVDITETGKLVGALHNETASIVVTNVVLE